VSGVAFVKGHGTGNDFVVIPDLDGALDLSPEQVRAICNRHTGIGADGVLRVVRSDHAPSEIDTTDTSWFMDYRNADGSVAEMCGNGIRVYVRYLQDAGLLVTPTVTLATRGGPRVASVLDDRTITVDMGTATSSMLRAAPVVTVNGRHWHAIAVFVPNPHAVAFVDDLADVGMLRDAPEVVPPAVFPDGVNVEFVTRIAPDHVSMRVFERGVGETLSCGTGACAAAWAWRRHQSQQQGAVTTQVDVPGGTLWVTEDPAEHLHLRGPAELVASGQLDDRWWQANSADK